MRLFDAVMLAALGFALYALAALMWDRRKKFSEWGLNLGRYRWPMPAIVVVGALFAGSAALFGSVLAFADLGVRLLALG